MATWVDLLALSKQAQASRQVDLLVDNCIVQQYGPALNTLENMGDLYALQAELAKSHV
jgi:hypothetical protein